MTLVSEIIKKHGPLDFVLVDACGVLYNAAGSVPSAGDTWNRIKGLGIQPVVLSNNTSISIPHIAERLQSKGFEINEQDIISSGLSLHLDAHCQSLIRGKRVYNYGWDSSVPYIEDAGGIISELDMAEAIICMASLKVDNEYAYEAIVAKLKSAPQTPVICANPDHHVWTPKGPYPVVGYYAKRLETELGTPVYWIGKPYANFSQVVKGILSQRFDLSSAKGLFFDDNPENLLALQRDLDIPGIVVRDTGLCQILPYRKHFENSGLPWVSAFKFSQ